MMAACFAIVIIVLISSFMCVRSGNKKFGLSILPISLIPLGHMLGSQILFRLESNSIVPEMAAMSIVTAVDVATLVAASAVMIVCSKSFFKKKSIRSSYCTILITFMAILTFILLMNFYREI